MGDWGLDPEREADMRRKSADVVAAARQAVLGRS
jgi:hypothetical protein